MRKHMDKHKRPHKCEHPGCTTPAFGDKSTLIRHQREVHDSRDGGRSAGEFCCPIQSCERQRRGFARRWNLLEHLRRMHNSEEQDGKLVLLSSGNQEHLGTHTMTSTQNAIPSPPPSLSSPQVAVSPLPPSSSTLVLRQQQLFTDMRGGSAIKRTHEESNSGYQGESLQAKLRRKEADRMKIDAEKQKLDQEISVLKEALAIV